MAYIRILDEAEEARDTVAEDYAFLSSSYSKILGEVGPDDEAYVDILNTVSIQTSLDRLANALGVRPDPVPLLALS